MNNQNKLISILVLFLYYFIAIILFVAGISKIIDPLPFVNTLFALNFSFNFVKIIMLIIPVSEIIISVFLFLKMRVKVTLSLTLLLFLGFLSFSIYGMRSGLTTDCGCFGGFVKSAIDWKLILRNTILLGITAILFINIEPKISRSLRTGKKD